MTPTIKQVRLLAAMAKTPAIAPWSCLDLVKLEQLKLVSGAIAIGANGKLHTSKVWTLTDAGRRLVESASA